MKSMFAVGGQLILSASNYLIFVLMVYLLGPTEFVAFSTAVGLNMLANAVAEGGMSYVAPRELSSRGAVGRASIAGAFISISVVLYCLVMLVGFQVWNCLSQDKLDSIWVLAYAVYFIPTLLMPAWVTCWSINLIAVEALLLVRVSMIVVLYWYPFPLTFLVSGVLFFGFVLLLLRYLNRNEKIISAIERPAFNIAVKGLMQVFFSKTMSYTVYGALPLVVSVFMGNTATSNYVTGERLKSLYAVLFQPIIQIMYLRQFTLAVRRIASVTLNVFNVMLCAGIVVGAYNGLFNMLGVRFNSIPNIDVYIIAAGFSVASASILHLQVFPTGGFSIFSRATFFQLLTFIFLILWMAISIDFDPGLLLCIGELVFFLALALQLLMKEARQKVNV